MKRALVSVMAGAAMLSASVAYAGPTPLAPAGAAGVKKAEGISDKTIMLIGGGALVIAGLALVLSDDNGHSGSATCTTPGSGGCGSSSTGTH